MGFMLLLRNRLVFKAPHGVFDGLRSRLCVCVCVLH